MRPVIEVKASNTVADFEARLEEIATSDRDMDLLLPNRLKGRFFGGMAAQMQLIATWRRSCPEGRLRVHAREAGSDDQIDAVLENFTKTDHGLVAAALGGAWTRRGERDLSGRVRELVDRRLAGMREAKGVPLRGAGALLICLDDSSFKAPPQLYQPRTDVEPMLRGLEDFRGLAGEAFHRLWVGTGVGSVDAIRQPGISDLGTLLYELFKNTHQWAREDVVGGSYLNRSSVRGIRFERLKLETSKEAELVEGQPALQEFLAQPALAPRDGYRRIVELTIFDCGPGIAARELRRMGEEDVRTDIGDEHEALRKCLRKHFTHDRSGRSRGVGLHAALRALSDLKSFLWVRSGRLSMYRDFMTSPYEPEHSVDEPFLLDWNARIGATEMARAGGAFITALIPITNVTEQTSF